MEGAAEKLLLPTMINMVGKRLNASYLTILEVGGAYAHRLQGLLSFIGIPYLVITDLDSVDAAGHHASCRGDTPGALTSNESLKQILGVRTVDELMRLTTHELQSDDKKFYITYQRDILVQEQATQLSMRPRTLEEALAYQNFTLLRTGEILLGVPIAADLETAYEAIYVRVASSNFKKTDFAMTMLASPIPWLVPAYIEEGLKWLEERLHGPAEAL